jgi:hypothetical protein
MNSSNITRALALLAALGMCTLVAQDKPKDSKPKEGASEEEMMKRWEAASTPGAPHKALEPLIGEWEIEARFWMGGPDTPPIESKGTTKAKWILGGRFIQEEVNSEMMGQPFQGIGTTGFDNLKKKYVSTWVDNMNTMISISEGTADADGKVFTFLGKMDDIMTGQKDKPFRYVLRIISSDKHVFEMHDPSLGAKSKNGEITYTRK